MQINDVYIHRATGKRVKIAEVKRTQEMSEVVTRFRMSGDNRFLTPLQVCREYGREVLEPAATTQGH